MSHKNAQIVDDEWITFPGGELEGKRPKALCPACRNQLMQAAAAQTASATRLRAVCFQCYRAEIDRDRALKAAGQLDTASAERFQTALPFEPVNRPRLEMLKAERSTARATTPNVFADRRRQARSAERQRPASLRGPCLVHWRSRSRRSMPQLRR